jgi:P4 family phage/plasmid primase-like protien
VSGAAPSPWPTSLQVIERPGAQLTTWTAHTSDVILARVLKAHWLQHGFELVGDLGELHYYDAGDGVWRVAPREFLGVQINSFDGTRIVDEYGTPTKKRVEINEHKIKGVINRLYDEVCHPAFFDSAPFGIQFTNGFLVVDATGATLKQHSRDHRARFALPYAWDPNAKAPLFEKYLSDVFEGDDDAEQKRAALQEWSGGALVRRSTDYEKAALCIGEPGSGKSVFAFVMKALYPPDQVASIAPHKLSHEYQCAALANKALNMPTELPSADMPASETWKAATSGDYISARHPSGRVFHFHPRCAHLVMGNSLPHITDETSAAYDRALIFTWNRRFRGTADQVVGLRDQIAATEMPGVAAWAVAGAIRLMRQRKYTHVPSAVKAADEWRQESTPILQWIAERCEASKDETLAGPLYVDFVQWCEANGNKPPSKGTFGKRLKAAGYPGRPGTNNTRLHRLVLKPVDVRFASYQVRALPGSRGVMFTAKLLDVDERELKYEFVAREDEQETPTWWAFAEALGLPACPWKEATKLVHGRARARLGTDGKVAGVIAAEVQQ